MAQDSFVNGDFPLRRLETFPGVLRGAALGLCLIGALAFAAALFADADRAWQAYLFNWLFWMGIAQGAVLLSACVVITKAVWARPVRRLSLSFAAFLPVAFLLYIPLAFAGESIFPWTRHMYHDGLEVWLNEPFVAVRNLVALGVLFSLSIAFAIQALRPDLGLLRDEAPDRLRGLYTRLTRGWRGQEEEEVRAFQRLNVLAPILALVYAASMSVVAWDYIMSLEAGWFSTLIGPYYFMAAFLGGIAATAILAALVRSRMDLAGVIEAPHFHDLGKLTFAFCVFWAYLLWSQYIVIWYGMLPHEQSFLVHRLSAPFFGMALLVFLFLFVAPFSMLLGVAAKKKPEFLASVAGVVLFGLWLERYLLIYPSLYPARDGLPFAWQEVGITLLFAGLFIASLGWFATRFPLLQLWQPMVPPEDLVPAHAGASGGVREVGE